MRIVIDMQGAQTESRFRGIGRYTTFLAQAIARNRGEHELILTLNDAFPDTIEPVRRSFSDLLPKENIRIWHTPGPVRWIDASAGVRRRAGEVVRADVVDSLHPDVAHTSSLFEGFGDDALTGVAGDRGYLESVSYYDLIPLTNPDDYLRHDLYRRFYFRKFADLNKADLCLAISDYSRRECLASTNVENVVNIASAADDVDFKVLEIDEAKRRKILSSIGVTKPFVLFVGGTDKRKNIYRFLEACALLKKNPGVDAQIVLVGKIPEGAAITLSTAIRSVGLSPDDVKFAGYVNDRDLAYLYNLCELFVFPSWQEGFGLPALEAMRCGAPVIASQTSSLPEVIGMDEALFDPFDPRSIADTMERALRDADFRAVLRDNGLRRAENYSWDESARSAITAFENSVRERSVADPARATRDPLVRVIDDLADAFRDTPVDDSVVAEYARAVARNNPPPGRRRKLFVDISELVQRDAATGIQRVTRSVLSEFLKSPPSGYEVEPVYAVVGQAGYRIANTFTRKLMGEEFTTGERDEPLDYRNGDVFFGLDLQHHVVDAQMPTLRVMNRHGVKVVFMIYDLLPIRMPQYFVGNMGEIHARWARNLSEFDGVVCISKAVADEYAEWLESNSIVPKSGFEIGWAHLGADIENSIPSGGLPKGYEATLEALSSAPSFLMVGTVEPRKGHAQVIEAFQGIWNDGLNVNLVIVGKPGWARDALFKTIDHLRETEPRFHYLGGISDEYLVKVFATASCLIAGSHGEGFGLPLIEAATRGLPIIARNIPVFREVAGECAFYFPDGPASNLTTAVYEWLDLRECGLHPRSDGMRRLTWRECARDILAFLTRGVS